jgi:hypothetical protein
MGVRAVGSDRRHRHACLKPGDGLLDGAEQQRRKLDHGLDDHSVHRRDRPDGAPDHGNGDVRAGHRAHQWDAVHIHGQGHQRHRDQRRILALRSHHPVGHDLRLQQHADDRRLRRWDPGGARGQVHVDTERSHHRHPLLQGGDEHRHAHRQPVDGERAAARVRDVQQRDGVGLADRHVPRLGPGHGGDDVRRRLLRAQRALLGNGGRPRDGDHQRAADGIGQRQRRRQRSVPLLSVEHLPQSELQRQRLRRGRALRSALCGLSASGGDRGLGHGC